MAILQSNREVRIKLQDLNEFITCELCKGYFIKPTTIGECLHTFCRSCIVKYLNNTDDNDCPKCSIVIHETNPFELLRSDQTLEDIIYKTVPELQERERKREEDFYAKLRQEEEEKEEEEEEKQNKDELAGRDNLARDEPQLSKDNPNEESKVNYHRDDPQIGLCLECLADQNANEHTVKELCKKYIRCSARMTVGHIKKYLMLKLNLSTADQVEVMCNGEFMGKDHTLEFVYMTRWRFKENSIFTLQYRPRVDFS